MIRFKLANGLRKQLNDLKSVSFRYFGGWRFFVMVVSWYEKLCKRLASWSVSGTNTPTAQGKILASASMNLYSKIDK